MTPDNDLYRVVITLSIKNDYQNPVREIVVGPYVTKGAVKAGIKRARKDHDWVWGKGNVEMIDFKWQKCRGWEATDEK